MRIKAKVGIGVISLIILGVLCFLASAYALIAMEAGIHPIAAWLIIPGVAVVIVGLVWFLIWCFE